MRRQKIFIIYTNNFINKPMLSISYLIEQLDKIELKRIELQKNVLDVNEREIYKADIKEQAELFKAHNAIIDFINYQSEIIVLLVNESTKTYSKEYVQDLQNTITKQRYYIKDLGGNPSNINFIKMQDLKQC
jgi:hypothetical protein